MNVKTIKKLLGDVRPKKGLGQHFLIDESVLDRIVAAAGVGPADSVLEIGPGLGVLTRALAEQAGHVTAVELDEQMVGILRDELAGFDNLEIAPGDILQIDPRELIAGPYIVVANLPYYITSAVLRHLLETEHKPARLVLTMQLEVAQRILARPGDMSILAVSVQFYGKPELVTRVPAGAFWPRPEVDSAVLRIDVYEEPPVAVDDVDWFFKVVRAGFGQKRKQLKNALAGGLHPSKAEVGTALEQAGIDPRRRAETLSLEEWAALARALGVLDS
ncbi:MAG: 16S rRNA (adenine(1518)-N(6)/adenine(1519)-N(6))-dimethyltransferase RsmA [Anaerolineae bacterium]